MNKGLTAGVSRRNFLKLTGAMGAAAGLSATLSACASNDGSSSSQETANPNDANPDGTIRAAISYELGTNGYDPLTTTSALTIAVNWHTLEGLTEIDPATGEVLPGLAEQVPQLEGTAIDITLREGAVFHNGDEVTADDVIYSFERVLDEANKSLYASFIPFIDSVTKRDERTVTINLTQETGVLANRLAVVKIVPRSVVENDPKGFDANPVGTGPWVMTDNGGTSKIVKFERFEDYTGTRPAKAAKMEWNIIPDASTRTNALQSQSVQAIDSVPYLSIDQLEATDSVESVQGFGLLFAMFNCSPDNPFQDVRNRQAFFYGIDIDRVIETGLLGQASPATSFLQEDHPDYHQASTVYSYDPDRAKKLFAETGLTKFRLLCTDHDWVKQCTPLIQESLSNLGLEVSFTERQSSDVYNTIDDAPEAYDVVIAPGDPSVFGTDPDLLMRWWYSSDTWTDSRMHWQGSSAYSELQDLLNKGLVATNSQQQRDYWNQCFDFISEQIPLYPLFHRKTPTAWDPSTLVNFKPISLTGLSFLDVETTTD